MIFGGVICGVFVIFFYLVFFILIGVYFIYFNFVIFKGDVCVFVCFVFVMVLLVVVVYEIVLDNYFVCFENLESIFDVGDCLVVMFLLVLVGVNLVEVKFLVKVMDLFKCKSVVLGVSIRGVVVLVGVVVVVCVFGMM